MGCLERFLRLHFLCIGCALNGITGFLSSRISGGKSDRVERDCPFFRQALILCRSRFVCRF